MMNQSAKITKAQFLMVLQKCQQDLISSTSQNVKKLPKSFAETAKAAKSITASSNSTAKKSTKKQMRTWNGAAPSAAAAKNLDYSSTAHEKPTHAFENADSLVDKSAMGKISDQGLYETAELGTSSSLISTKLIRIFDYFTADRQLNQQDLAPCIESLKTHLIEKNVAAEISGLLCEKVRAALIGKRHAKFSTSSITSIVSNEMEIAIQKILTPSTSTDILRDILAVKSSRSKRPPFSMVFVGVNGVGKSTNLSKVAFWLLHNKFRVLIAACDTFRSGAVEQLRVHVRNLTHLSDRGTTNASGCVELFEKGYGKDSAAIAREAIKYAGQHSFDVVLIDTAGRMQDNEPLMRALAKLVSTNNPDKIVFVGEALVGNEAVDQLTKFNRALEDFGGPTVNQAPRQIDGIILTKFDTVDDKVGAALGMTYVTGKPVLFVGTGQTYTDLKRMNIKTIVATLLS